MHSKLQISYFLLFLPQTTTTLTIIPNSFQTIPSRSHASTSSTNPPPPPPPVSIMLPEPEDEIFDDLCFRIENEVVDRLNVSMTSSHLDEVLGNGPVREPAVPPVVSVNSTSSGPTASNTTH